MAIPGSTAPRLDVRAKVRVGEKSGKFAKSVDYFITDDAEFGRRYPNKTSEIEIVFVHEDPSDAFRTGLEWWKGSLLACYSDDGGESPTAFRVSQMKLSDKTLNLLDPDDEIRSDRVFGNGRTAIACRFRSCPHFGSNPASKECAPKGRLSFLLPDGRRDALLLLETKSWNTIEAIDKALTEARARGPLNAPGRVFTLSVSTQTKGTKRFPVCTVKEVNVEATEEKVDLADALLQLRASVDRDDEAAALKLRIAAVLDLMPELGNWRENPQFIQQMQARVAEVGVQGAARNLLARFEA